MTRIVVLTDRSPADALPALVALSHDVKAEALDAASLPAVTDLTPGLVLVDAAEEPDRAFGLLSASGWPAVPVLAVIAPADVGRLPWQRVADDFVVSTATADETALRLTLVMERAGGSGEHVLRLGPLAIDTDAYQVTLAGRPVDLTFKEFELLRFLVQHAGRVFTRGALLQEVWGYDFYGGTRTVDVHVRRLRAKLGAADEGLIETVRGVGYRAAADVTQI
jgi:DNA-binding response OmpR family regulator